MMRALFEGALYFSSVYAACVVYSRARSIRRARTIRGNTVVFPDCGHPSLVLLTK